MLRITDVNGNVIVDDEFYDLGLKAVFSEFNINDFDKINFDGKEYKIGLVKVTNNTFVKNDKNKMVKVNRIYVLYSDLGELYMYKTLNNRIHQTRKIKVIYK